LVWNGGNRCFPVCCLHILSFKLSTSETIALSCLSVSVLPMLFGTVVEQDVQWLFSKCCG
jgi:hypothetical protein